LILLAKKRSGCEKTHSGDDGAFRRPCDAGTGGCQVRTGYVLLPLDSCRRLPDLQRSAGIRTRKILAARRKLRYRTHTIAARHICFLYTAWWISRIAILWLIKPGFHFPCDATRAAQRCCVLN